MSSIRRQSSYALEVLGQSQKIEDLRTSLLQWFLINGRHWIPWKLKPDGSIPKNNEELPVYPIWVAEVMLQQTQLQVVLPYWKAWMKTFPSLSDLACALEQDVLLVWQGLGYYSRAHRIHNAAKLLMEADEVKSGLDEVRWPEDLQNWMSLPGIGRSTAASILSSAFNTPEAILDGNVKRILSRLVGSNQILSKNSGLLWEISSTLLDINSPRNFNQALMDLGSMICTRSKPKCLYCPWQNSCIAYYQGEPEKFPVKDSRKLSNLVVIGIGLIINDKGQVLIDKRLSSQNMGGMWEFPGGKNEKGESIEFTIVRELYEELGVKIKLGKKLIEFDHSYTHQKLKFVVYLCKILNGEPKALSSSQVKWVDPKDLINYPFPTANQKMITALNEYLIISKDN